MPSLTGLPEDAPGTIMQLCDSDAYNTTCRNGTSFPWPAAYLQGAEQLLLLKAAAADSYTTMALATWQSDRPPCTNSQHN